jgi:hypothetical protein
MQKARTPSLAPDSALIVFESVVALGRPLGRERTRRLKRDDPRFPKAVIGEAGGNGNRQVWSRQQVIDYWKRFADEGPVTKL